MKALNGSHDQRFNPIRRNMVARLDAYIRRRYSDISTLELLVARITTFPGGVDKPFEDTANANGET
jgi:hypothetical protein